MNSSGESDANEVCLVDDDLSVLVDGHCSPRRTGRSRINKPEDFLAHAAAHPVRVVVTDI